MKFAFKSICAIVKLQTLYSQDARMNIGGCLLVSYTEEKLKSEPVFSTSTQGIPFSLVY